MSSEIILEGHELCTYYGYSQVLFDVSLKLPKVGCVAILGRNGAGKTTLLKTLAGELSPRSGRVQFHGRDMLSLPIEDRVIAGLGYVPQEHGVFGRLTVMENLQVGAMAAKAGTDRIEEMIALFPRLGQRLTQPAGTMSGGERKMLAISRALLSNPSLLILDEPTEGVWHGVIDEITSRLQELAQRISILIVEQHVKMALSIAGHCYVMDRGQIALSGPADQVRQDPQLERLLAP